MSSHLWNTSWSVWGSVTLIKRPGECGRGLSQMIRYCYYQKKVVRGPGRKNIRGSHHKISIGYRKNFGDCFKEDKKNKWGKCAWRITNTSCWVHKGCWRKLTWTSTRPWKEPVGITECSTEAFRLLLGGAGGGGLKGCPKICTWKSFKYVILRNISTFASLALR